MPDLTLMAVGDVILDLENHHRAFDHAKDVLRQGDVVIANIDQILSDIGSSPNDFWPIYVSAVPHSKAMIDSLADAGITVLNFGNNHALDWGYDSVFDCLENCNQKGLQTVGIGRDLEAARRPVIVECQGTKIGFLAYCCVGPDGYNATDVRPGFVPVRAHTYYEQWDPQPGTPPLIHTFAHREDLAAMVRDVEKLHTDVDVVACYFHWGVHYVPELIADYQYEVGHAAVDAGADVVFGVHAHLPKGIEVYKGKVIFHGLHNFACRGEWMPPSKQPGSKYPDSHHWDFTRHGEMFKVRFGEVPEEIRKPTMIAKVAITNRRVSRVAYQPCWINEDKDPVALKAGDERAVTVFNYIEKISRSQGLDTRFNWDGDDIVITASKITDLRRARETI